MKSPRCFVAISLLAITLEQCFGSLVDVQRTDRRRLAGVNPETYLYFEDDRIPQLGSEPAPGAVKRNEVPGQLGYLSKRQSSRPPLIPQSNEEEEEGEDDVVGQLPDSPRPRDDRFVWLERSRGTPGRIFQAMQPSRAECNTLAVGLIDWVRRFRYPQVPTDFTNVVAGDWRLTAAFLNAGREETTAFNSPGAASLWPDMRTLAVDLQVIRDAGPDASSPSLEVWMRNRLNGYREYGMTGNVLLPRSLMVLTYRVSHRVFGDGQPDDAEESEFDDTTGHGSGEFNDESGASERQLYPLQDMRNRLLWPGSSGSADTMMHPKGPDPNTTYWKAKVAKRQRGKPGKLPYQIREDGTLMVPEVEIPSNLVLGGGTSMTAAALMFFMFTIFGF